MENQFILNLKENCRINFDKPIVLGISGGIDSICMLNLFSKTGIPAVVAHFQHGLRESAEGDALFVEKLAEKYNFPFEVRHEKINEIAEKEHLSVEEAARNYRYHFLFDVAEKYEAQSVAVAHNADDQVETVLMHLLRGSGLSGLTGMDHYSINNTFHSKIPLIRPMLNFWRTEIELFVKSNSLGFRIDPTNLDTKYNRNKIRHEILPFLENSYPGLKKRILNMSSVLKSDEEILEKNINSIFETISQNYGDKFLEFSTDSFVNLEEGLQRRLIRKALYECDSTIRDVSFQVIDRAVNFIRIKRNGIIDLTNGFNLEATEKKFYIFPQDTNWSECLYPQHSINQNIRITQPGSFHFGKNWMLEVKLITDQENKNFATRSSNEATIDFQRVGGFPMFLGVPQAGERFSPLGMKKGSVKLSDFFINSKLPKSARLHWPILRNSRNEIIWVPGFRPAQPVRISNETKEILLLRIDLKKN